MNNKKSTLKKVLVIALVALVGLSVLGYFVKDKNFAVPKKEAINGTHEIDKSTNPYQFYVDKTNTTINSFSKEKKENREKIYTELKANSVYKSLVNDAVVSMNFMPCLSGVALGISSTSVEGYSMSEEYAALLDHLGQLDFAIKVLALNSNGGVPTEIVNVFERYKNKYKFFGEKGIIVDANGSKENISYSYDIAPFFGMIDPKNTTVLNSIYEAKQKGLSNWGNIKNATYPYLNSKAEYMSYVKQVYPESPYILKVDIEITANELYSAYNANEVAADEKYKGKKIAVTGVISDIRKDFAGNAKISLEIGILQTINCNFGKNAGVVSKLNKQDKITVVGICKGFIVKQVVVDNCEVGN